MNAHSAFDIGAIVPELTRGKGWRAAIISKRGVVVHRTEYCESYNSAAEAAWKWDREQRRAAIEIPADPCPECDGSGGGTVWRCPDCKGTGRRS